MWLGVLGALLLFCTVIESGSACHGSRAAARNLQTSEKAPPSLFPPLLPVSTILCLRRTPVSNLRRAYCSGESGLLARPQRAVPGGPDETDAAPLRGGSGRSGRSTRARRRQPPALVTGARSWRSAPLRPSARTELGSLPEPLNCVRARVREMGLCCALGGGRSGATIIVPSVGVPGSTTEFFML